MNRTLPNIDWDPSNPPKTLLADEMALALEHLKEFISPDMKEVPPHVILLGIDFDKATVVRNHVLLVTVDERRHQMMRDLGAEYAKTYIPIAGVFVSPSWVSTMTDEQIKTKGCIRPSKDPERKECLLVSGALFNRKTATVMIPAYRAEDGCVRIAWGEAITTMEAEPILLYRFFEGAALTLKDRKPNQPNQ